MQAPPLLSPDRPHSGSPLHHTLPSRGPGALGAGVHGEGADTGRGLHVGLECLTLRAAVCLAPPPTPTSSAGDAPGPAQASSPRARLLELTPPG